MYSLTESDISKISSIIINNKKVITAGDVSRIFFEQNKDFFRKNIKKNDIGIKKEILKSFTKVLAEKLKKFKIYRKRRPTTKQFIYYYID
jgi:hypothetical protein